MCVPDLIAGTNTPALNPCLESCTQSLSAPSPSSPTYLALTITESPCFQTMQSWERDLLKKTGDTTLLFTLSCVPIPHIQFPHRHGPPQSTKVRAGVLPQLRITIRGPSDH